MGNTFFSAIDKLVSTFAGLEDKRILLLGLDAAGKTTLLYSLKVREESGRHQQ
jgi:GTPase SAR1 family protein